MRNVWNRLVGLSFLVWILSTPNALGQTTTPPAQAPAPVFDKFVVSANASGITGVGGGTHPASNVGTSLQLTASISAGYNQLTIQDTNTYFRMGVVNYTKPLSSLLGKKASAAFVFDPSQIQITFQGGLGKVTQNFTGLPSTHHIAEEAGVFIIYPLSDHLNAQLFGYQVYHGGTQNLGVQYNQTQAISTGLVLHF